MDHVSHLLLFLSSVEVHYREPIARRKTNRKSCIQNGVKINESLKPNSLSEPQIMHVWYVMGRGGERGGKKLIIVMVKDITIPLL